MTKIPHDGCERVTGQTACVLFLFPVSVPNLVSQLPSSAWRWMNDVFISPTLHQYSTNSLWVEKAWFNTSTWTCLRMIAEPWAAKVYFRCIGRRAFQCFNQCRAGCKKTAREVIMYFSYEDFCYTRLHWNMHFNKPMVRAVIVCHVFFSSEEMTKLKH